MVKREVNELFLNYFSGAIRVLDDTELNSDVKIRFTLDETGLNEKLHSCISSEDSIQCIETKNEDKIWIQVLIVVAAVFNF